MGNACFAADGCRGASVRSGSSIEAKKVPVYLQKRTSLPKSQRSALANEETSCVLRIAGTAVGGRVAVSSEEAEMTMLDDYLVDSRRDSNTH
jgi:hypothetical protein